MYRSVHRYCSDVCYRTCTRMAMPRVSSWRYTVFSLISHTARKTDALWRPVPDRQLSRQRRTSARRRASSRVRRWSPPPGQASTSQSCRTTAGQNETRLPAPPPPATAPESALPPPLTHARGLRPAGVRASRLHSPAQPPLLSRRCSLSPPTTMPPPPSPPPPTPTPTPPGRPPPRALPPPTPSAARRSVLAPPAAPTGDPPAQVHALRCLPQTQCLPSHTPTPSSPRPTPSHPLYTPHHNHGAAFHRAYPTGRRHPTRSSPTRLPPFPLPHPKPPPPDAQPHRAASPHALPRDTRRSIHSDRPCPPSPAQSREPHRNPPRYKGQHPSPDAWTSPPSTLARSIIVGVGTLVASLPSFVGALRAPLR